MSDRVPTLEDSRMELDALDVSLVQVLVRRSQVILDVIRYKRAQSMAVVDRDREDQIIAGIERVAVSEGLDPRVARQVLRAVIDAFTLLEVEELGPDLDHDMNHRPGVVGYLALDRWNTR